MRVGPGARRRGTLRERKDDFHRTPVEAVRALAQIELLPRCLWEPACGDGAIVLPLRDAGYEVLASDLVDRGCPDSDHRVDFLMERRTIGFCTGIVTNPPYKLAQAFAEHAISLVPYVAMLLPLSFLAGQERRSWHLGAPLARVWVSSRRLPMMHKDGWAGTLSTSTVDHAWFVWDTRWKVGNTIVNWFDWKDAGPRVRGPHDLRLRRLVTENTSGAGTGARKSGEE